MLDQVVPILGAVTALLVAFAAVLQRIESLRRAVNGRLSELLDAKTTQARKEGEMAGRDFVHRLYNPPTDTPEAPPA